MRVFAMVEVKPIPHKTVYVLKIRELISGATGGGFCGEVVQDTRYDATYWT